MRQVKTNYEKKMREMERYKSSVSSGNSSRRNEELQNNYEFQNYIGNQNELDDKNKNEEVGLPKCNLNII